MTLAALLLIGCDGLISDPGAGPGGPRLPGDPLDPTSDTLCREGDVPDAVMRRVDRTTYVNALAEVLGTAPVDAVQATLEALTVGRAGTYSTEVGAPSYAEVSSYVDVASALAWWITEDAARMNALDPCLSTLGAAVDPATDACLGGFVDAFGRKLLRRPLDAAERTGFLSAYEIGSGENAAEGVATMLITMLVDPSFLYFVETRGVEVGPGVFTVSSHELAARLALVLWSSAPDDALLDAADAGLDAAALDAQIERMWNDPRTRTTLGRFYSDWLTLDTLPYAAAPFANDATERNALRTAMQDELVGFAEHLTFDASGSYRDLLLDQTSYIRSPLLARIYGLPDSTSGEVTLTDPNRAGLLTRAAFLATIEVPGSDAGHVIKRGVRFSHIICREPPPPNPNLFPPDDPADPATDPDRSIRDRFLAATAEPQCVSCHESIDAMGAPFGHFGSAGQWIESEHITTSDGTEYDVEIDPTASLVVDSDPVDVASALDVSSAIADSRSGPTCFAVQLTQSFLGRELNATDGCLVERARDVLLATSGTPGSIRDAIVAMITSPEFATTRLR